MKTLIALNICLLAPFITTSATPFAGLTAREILAVINSDYRPTDYALTATGDDGAWATIYRYAVTDKDYLLDYFSDSQDYRATLPPPPTDLYLTNIVPAPWWGDTYGDLPAHDLHNIVTANGDVEQLKGVLSPGVVTEPSYDNAVWQVGKGSYCGRLAPMYTPPEGYKGDFARAMMYCCAVYPMELWQSNGFYIFADGNYPLLTDYGKELLLAWHRLDPVDDFESRRNRIIAERQGNANPFITYPDLAEYVWGEHAGEPLPSDAATTEPDTEPDATEELTPSQPLRAVYSQSADTALFLYSPYIESDAAWTIDGREVTADAIPVADLAVGAHTLTYTTATRRGALIIYITE